MDPRTLRNMLSATRQAEDGQSTSGSIPSAPSAGKRRWVPRSVRSEGNVLVAKTLKNLLLETLADDFVIQSILHQFAPPSGANLPRSTAFDEIPTLFAPFSALPPEIRHKIYLLALPTRCRRGLQDAKANAAGNLPSLALVCKESYGLLHSNQFYFSPPSLKLPRPLLVYPHDIIYYEGPTSIIRPHSLGPHWHTIGQRSPTQSLIAQAIKARGFAAINVVDLDPPPHMQIPPLDRRELVDEIKDMEYLVTILLDIRFYLPVQVPPTSLFGGRPVPRLSRIVELDDVAMLKETLQLVPKSQRPQGSCMGDTLQDQWADAWIDDIRLDAKRTTDRIQRGWIMLHHPDAHEDDIDLFPPEGGVNLEHPRAKKIFQRMPDLRPAVQFSMSFISVWKMRYQEANGGNLRDGWGPGP